MGGIGGIGLPGKSDDPDGPYGQGCAKSTDSFEFVGHIASLVWQLNTTYDRAISVVGDWSV
jgi:hypothetical protein